MEIKRSFSLAVFALFILEIFSPFAYASSYYSYYSDEELALNGNIANQRANPNGNSKISFAGASPSPSIAPVQDYSGTCVSSVMDNAEVSRYQNGLSEFQSEQLSTLSNEKLKTNDPTNTAAQQLQININIADPPVYPIRDIANLLEYDEKQLEQLAKEFNVDKETGKLNREQIRAVAARKSGGQDKVASILGISSGGEIPKENYESFKVVLPNGKSVPLKEIMANQPQDKGDACLLDRSFLSGKVTFQALLNKDLFVGFDQSKTVVKAQQHLTSKQTTAALNSYSGSMVIPKMYERYTNVVGSWSSAEEWFSLAAATSAMFAKDGVNGMKKQLEDNKAKLEGISKVNAGRIGGDSVQQDKLISEALDLTNEIEKKEKTIREMAFESSVVVMRPVSIGLYGMGWMGAARLALSASNQILFSSLVTSDIKLKDNYLQVYINNKDYLTDFRKNSDFFGTGKITDWASDLMEAGAPTKAYETGKTFLVATDATPEQVQSDSVTSFEKAGGGWQIKMDWKGRSDGILFEDVRGNQEYTSMAMYSNNLELGTTLKNRDEFGKYYDSLAVLAIPLNFMIYRGEALKYMSGPVSVLIRAGTFDLVVTNIIDPMRYGKDDICDEEKVDNLLFKYRALTTVSMAQSTFSILFPTKGMLQVIGGAAKSKLLSAFSSKLNPSSKWYKLFVEDDYKKLQGLQNKLDAQASASERYMGGAAQINKDLVALEKTSITDNYKLLMTKRDAIETELIKIKGVKETSPELISDLAKINKDIQAAQEAIPIYKSKSLALKNAKQAVELEKDLAKKGELQKLITSLESELPDLERQVPYSKNYLDVSAQADELTERINEINIEGQKIQAEMVGLPKTRPLVGSGTFEEATKRLYQGMVLIDPIQLAKQVIASEGFEYVSLCKDTNYKVIAYQRISGEQTGANMEKKFDQLAKIDVGKQLNITGLLGGIGQKVDEQKLTEMLNLRSIMDNPYGQLQPSDLYYIHLDGATQQWFGVYDKLNKNGCFRECFDSKNAYVCADAKGVTYTDKKTGKTMTLSANKDRGLMNLMMQDLARTLIPNRIISAGLSESCFENEILQVRPGVLGGRLIISDDSCDTIACLRQQLAQLKSEISTDLSASAFGNVIAIYTNEGRITASDGRVRFIRGVAKEGDDENETIGGEIQAPSLEALDEEGAKSLSGIISIKGNMDVAIKGNIDDSKEIKEESAGKLLTIITERGRIEYDEASQRLVVALYVLAKTKAADSIKSISTSITSNVDANGNDVPAIAIPHVQEKVGFEKEVKEMNDALKEVQTDANGKEGGFQVLETDKFRYTIGTDANGNPILTVLDKTTGKATDYAITGPLRREGNDIIIPTDKGDFKLSLDMQNGKPMLDVSGPDGFKELAMLLAAKGPGGIIAFDPRTGLWYALNGQDIPWNQDFATKGMTLYNTQDGLRGTANDNLYSYPRRNPGVPGSGTPFSIPSIPDNTPYAILMILSIVAGALFVRMGRRGR